MFYLAALAPSSVGFGAVAIFHFIVGYVWGTGMMAAPLTARLALFGTFLGGAFACVSLLVGTVEWLFAWAGPLAALGLADTTSPRNITYSMTAFVAGAVLAALALVLL